MSAQIPAVSVIIPAYNEERFIAQCLDALLPQVRELAAAGESCEVLVVDNGSTDGTREICESRGVAVLQAPKLRVGAVRNAGVAAARGALLAFLDADCVPRRDWLRAVLRSQDEGACLTGSTYALPATTHWIEAAWFATEAPGRREATHINAGNLVIPADVFRAVGGFDATLASGEDFELAQRVRRQLPVISDDRISVVHLGNPKTLRRFVQREIWHGLGALASARHDWRDKPLMGTLAFVAGVTGVVVGSALGVLGHGWRIAAASAMLLGALLILTVEYRTRLRHGVLLRAQLLLLYTLFYGGRAVALVRLAFGGTRYLRSK
jgi:glycosyltransferase involved in cell wall biosynthesis